VDGEEREETMLRYVSIFLNFFDERERGTEQMMMQRGHSILSSSSRVIFPVE
jgi:hypothetical protein